jgi:hypothetical protein
LVNLWLYWSATFIGTSIVAVILRNKFFIEDQLHRLKS